MEFLEWLKYPEYYPLVFALISGYVIFSVFAGETTIWSKRNTFEKLMMSGALGFAIFYGMIVPYVSLVTPWLGLTDNQVFYFSGLIILALGILIPITLQNLGISGRDMFNRFEKLPLALIVISLVEFFTVALFNIQIEGFSLSYQKVMFPFWNIVLEKSLTHLASVFSLCYMVFFMFVLRLSNEFHPKSEKLSQVPFKKLITNLKPHINRRNGLIAILLIGIIVAPSIIIKVDNSFHFITPSLEVSDEAIPDKPTDYYDDIFVLTRLETGRGESLDFYQVRYTQYRLIVPELKPLREFLNADSIFLSNPNNISRTLDTGHPSQLPIWSHINHLWLNVPENLTITPQLNGNVLEGLLVDLENMSGSEISFNMTYFKQLTDMDVNIDKDESLGDYVNGTRHETYYFYITNNEDIPLWLPYFELITLYQNIDDDSVQVFKDGELVTYAMYGTYIRPDMYIHPHTQGNLTISLTTLP